MVFWDLCSVTTADAWSNLHKSNSRPLKSCFNYTSATLCFGLVWFGLDFGFVEVLPKMSFEKKSVFEKMDV